MHDGVVGGSCSSRRFSSPWPGHQAAWPISAVSAGVKNIAITNAAMKMPKESAKPIDISRLLPPSISEAKVPARITPAAAMVGPACLNASAAAGRGSRPSRASSRSRAIIRML